MVVPGRFRAGISVTGGFGGRSLAIFCLEGSHFMSVPHAHRSVAVLATLLAASTVGLGAVTSAQAASVCGPSGYAAPIATTTGLSLARSVMEYGSVDVATVKVSSGAGTPSGSVRLGVSDGSSYRLTLDRRGTARQELPRRLPAQRTYAVTASYDGRGSCQASGPVRKYVTVVRADTDVRGLEVRDIRSGGRPTVTGRVRSDTGITPDGAVRVMLTNGDLEKVRTVDQRGGRFSATFGRTYQAGTWKVRAAFLGDRDFRDSDGTTKFRVKG